MDYYFKEEQKFDQRWIWVSLLSVLLIPIYGLYKQIVVGEPFGDHPLSNAGLLVVLSLILVLIIFYWSLKLTTEISEDTIYVRFFPFTKRKILWADIDSAKVIDYGFVGGWGIRKRTKYGTVYNTRGSLGLALELKSGNKICIGTQKVDELVKAINLAKRDQKV